VAQFCVEEALLHGWTTLQKVLSRRAEENRENERRQQAAHDEVAAALKRAREGK
jgi:hypothetical protein